MPADLPEKCRERLKLAGQRTYDSAASELNTGQFPANT